MRRTRHVALPVRAWQYVGLLIVSLACLTLGLVSRDKEGRAGSLAGPELKHRAPHEVDACPNFSPFAKLPSCSILEQDPARVPKISGETASVRSSQIPADRRISRSRNLDRVSETRMQSRTDCKSMERLARQEPNVDNDSSRLVRLSRSLNLDDARLTTRSLDRRSHAERRLVAVDQREHREASATGTTERRERLGRSNNRFDIRDRRSHSVKRRGSIVSERIDRNDRLEIRERRTRSLERRTLKNLERRINGKLENVRGDRRNRIVYRIEKRVDDRRSVSRASIRQDNRQESRSNLEENRRNVRSVSGERQDSGSSRDQDRRSLIRTTENTRRLDSRLPGDIERTTMTRRVNRQTSRRSVDRRNSRTAREHEASREQKPESTDIRRESTSRNVQLQDRMQPIARRESRSNLDHRFQIRTRTDQRDIRNQRSRGTIVRMDRRMNGRLNERRATSLTRSSERSIMGNTERRENNRLNLAREKRDSERQEKEEQRSTVAESVNKQDSETNRLHLTRESRTPISRLSEIVKRDSERRVTTDLSNGRRSSERKSPISDPGIRQQVRTDRRLSTLNTVERRERTNRLNLARETVKRDSERRVTTDLSNGRRSSERKSPISDPGIRQQVRTDRRLSTLNAVERRERTNRLNLARETVKRDSERRVTTDLSNGRRSSERKSPISDRAIRQQVRTDRRLSALNSVERRERTNKLNIARESQAPLTRLPETANRDSERRVRNLSSDRLSTERRSTILESARRRGIRTDRRLSERSRLNGVEERERTNTLYIARVSRIPLTRSSETIKRNSERRVRNLSNDRLSTERRSTILESARRQEMRTDRRLSERSRLNGVERRERTNTLYIARESRIPLTRSYETAKRDFERRVRDLSNDRRSSERRSTVFEFGNHEEIRTDRRSRLINLERRDRTNRLYLTRESEIPRHSSSNRRLEHRQLVHSKRYSEATVLEHLNNERIETERSRQRLNVNRLQPTRATILTNDPRSNQREQRLTEKTRVLLTTLRSKPLNGMKRSRLVNQRLIRFSDKGSRIFSNLKDSVDLNTQIYVKSSRASTISANDRSFATRGGLFSRINAYRTNTVDIQSYLKEENSMKYTLTFQVLQQALVIGLCALYSLSIFRGKQSFVSTVVRQASRIILW